MLCGAACVLALSGCGRLGFDSGSISSLGDGGPDASGIDAGASAPSFADLCNFDSHVIIENGLTVDDDAGQGLSVGVVSGCMLSATIRTASQDDPAEVDQATGRPLSNPDELVVLGGGDGPHVVVRYLLGMDTPLQWSGGGATTTIVERSSGRVVAEGPTSETDDLIMLQVLEEPIGGAVVLSGQGLFGNGTRAAALYFQTEFAAQIEAQDFGWQVVRWTDSDGTAGPSADDDFLVIESG
jgi:hypothetical protein